MYPFIYPRKLEVNCEWGENKAKQTLYKEVSTSAELTLAEREFEVSFNP
jgi:hypothetical protein